ncbi:MAG: DUF1192 domain-containing protein [Pseudomonadota bacterium]
MFDDNLPRPKPTLFTPQSLDKLSMDELETYITAMQVEITRVQAEITRKTSHAQAAAAIFGKKGE